MSIDPLISRSCERRRFHEANRSGTWHSFMITLAVCESRYLRTGHRAAIDRQTMAVAYGKRRGRAVEQ